MEGISYGTRRIKVGTIEFKGNNNILGIIEESLISKGYDIDIEPQNNDFNSPSGVKMNIYEVRNYRK